MLSCRALGRGIETAFARRILQLLRVRKIERVYAEYLPTAKNAPCANFLPTLGFVPESDAPERFDHFRDVLRRLTARHDALLAYPESREECELLEPVIRDVQALLDQETS